MKIARIISPHINNIRYLVGALLVIASLFLALALISYNPADPSFNRASNDQIQNLAGKYGAFIADPVLQLIGLASAICVLIPLIWGTNLILNKSVTFWLMRFMMFVMCILATAALLDNIPLENSVFNSSFGGIIGKTLANKIQAISIIPPYIIIIATISVSLLCFFAAAALKLETWKYIGVSIGYAIYYTYKFSRITILTLCYPLYYLYCTLTYAKSPNYDISTELKKEIKSTIRKEKKLPGHTKQLLTSISKYLIPPLELLTMPSEKSKKQQYSEAFLNQNARKLEQVLVDFGIYGTISGVHQGPVVTLYELEPAAGTKSSRIIGLADDISRSMSAVSARIAVIPGRNAIGIELPNPHRETVYLRELLESYEYSDNEHKLPLVLGKDIAGKTVVTDLSRMPHLLVAGTTGSGKSVAINTMILSLIYKLTPEQCKFIMIDPKMLELSVYEGIPHLLTPVVTEPRKAVVALKWVVKEMETRYRMMSSLGVRNIAGYNQYILEAQAQGENLSRPVHIGFDPETGKPLIEQVPIPMDPLPFIVVIVDEMADLMVVAGKDIETSVQRLSQMARAAGIHIIMATQRPSVDVITGVIKANFPTRISFQVTSRIDSRTILGEQGGAEQLLGMGDMLYMSGGSRITRVHGPFVDDREVEKIVNYLKTQGNPQYIDDITYDHEGGDFNELGASGEERDELYDQAVAIVARDRKVSTSYIQRCLKIGYNRAATIIERMEREGVIGAANHVGKREILIPLKD